MSPKFTKTSLWLASVLFVCLCPFALQAQDAATPTTGTQDSGMAMHKTSHGMMSVSGCLAKGAEEGGYIITGDDGKVWELSSKSIKLADHVGHQVTVSGTRPHMSKSEESKMMDNEKGEAAGKPYGDLKVTKLMMVSTTCSTN